MSENDSLDDLRERKKEKLLEAASNPDSPSEPLHVDGETDFNKAIEQYDVVLADFYADWCGPCKMLAPTVEALAAETEAAVVKIDVDENQPLAQQFGVQGVPTLVLFADGQQVEQLVGVQDKDTLAGKIAGYT
jgi:thioredoxin 1